MANPVSRCGDHGAEGESCWIRALSAGFDGNGERAAARLRVKYMLLSFPLHAVRAVEVWRPLWHTPILTVLYFGRCILKYTRYPTTLCSSSSAGSAQDWCSWKNSVEDQYWNSTKTGRSVPINITTRANLGKNYIKDHLFPALCKLMAFPISTTELDPTAILVAGSSIMQSRCAKNMLKTLLPVSEPHSSCWGGAKQAKHSLSFCREVQ